MTFQGSRAVSFAVSFSRHSVDLPACCYDTDAQDLACLLLSVVTRSPNRLLRRRARQIPPSRLDGSQSTVGDRPWSPLSQRAWPKRSVGCAWKPVSTSLIRRRQLSSSGRSHAHAHACGGHAVHPTQRRLSCG